MTVAAQIDPQMVIREYLSDRAARDWPVSIATAVQSIRAALPECGLSDRVLAEMVEVAAIRGGHCVAFDACLHQEERHPPVSIEVWVQLGSEAIKLNGGSGEAPRRNSG